jgi:hypothetical protein
MSQTAYNINQSEAFAGMKVDSRFDTVESHLAEGAIDFGLGVMSGFEDAVRQVRIPSKIQSVLSIDADLIASNSTIATVNGNDTAPVVYATSHAATMTALAAAIAGLDDVLSATYPGSGRDITIVGEDGVAIDASAVTTLGASQGTWTQVQSDPGVFRGIAIHRHVEKAQVTGVAQYADKEAVDVSRKGVVWMPVVIGVTVLPDEDAYINLAITAEAGKVTNVSSGNIATGGKVRKVTTDPAGANIAAIEINLP